MAKPRIYRQHHQLWEEKTDVFVKTAMEVYARQKKSGAAVKYIAEYFWSGLHDYDRGIEILSTAHKQKLLDKDGQSTLVYYLHERDRFGESIAILRPLVQRRQDNMQYRVWLMQAYFHAAKQKELLAILQQTDEYFHQNGRWTEGHMAALAKGCLDTNLYEQAAAYYKEVISLHKRNQPQRGSGDERLSNYCRSMAQAYAGLKNTALAVDAACEAIVCWGPRHEQRQEALDTLKHVLRNAADLDAYVAELDRQCQESKKENQIVRKALGQVYLRKGKYGKAIAQLRLVCEVQPNDTQTHDKLIECYDKQQDKEGAVQQVLDSLQSLRHDIDRYKNLAERLQNLGRAEEAERAFTSIVEMLPSESESHAMLAEIREGQDRWDEAVVHWRQVAQIRDLEPTGLQRLAAALIHLKQWDSASQTLRELDTRSWPPRFSEVHERVGKLRQEIEDAQDK